MERGILKIKQNPVLEWNLSCVSVNYDQYDNRVYKRSEIDRTQGCIDGIISLTMSLSLAKYMMNNKTGGIDHTRFYEMVDEIERELAEAA